MCCCARVCAAVQQVQHLRSLNTTQQELEPLGQRCPLGTRPKLARRGRSATALWVFIALQQGSPARVSTSIDFLFWLVVHQCVWSDGMRDDGGGRPLEDPFVVRKYQRADGGSRMTWSHSLRPGLN